MRTVMMVASICFLTLFVRATEPARSTSAVIPTYELYSWQEADGSWSFSLLYTTNRQKTAEEVFSDKAALHGVAQLKQKLSKLPKSSRIVWFDRLTLRGAKIEGTERLKYPPKDIVDDVKRCAELHSIKFSGPRE